MTLAPPRPAARTRTAPPVRPRPLPVPAVEHDEVDEWGVQSFPASDPPSNW